MRISALTTQAQNFAAICRAPFDKVPTLEDFLAGKNIPTAVVRIGIKPQEDRPKLEYASVYDVVSATMYEACKRRVGEKVEVIGRIVEV